MPAKPLPPREQPERKRNRSSKVTDPDNIEKMPTKKRCINAKQSACHPSVKLKEVEDEEAFRTFQHPKNPARLLEASDGSDDDDDKPSATAHKGRTGQKKRAEVTEVSDKEEDKDEEEKDEEEEDKP